MNRTQSYRTVVIAAVDNDDLARRKRRGVAAILQSLVPVVATIVGVVVLDEEITPLTILGFAIVFLGFLVLKRRAIADLVDGATGTAESTGD